MSFLIIKLDFNDIDAFYQLTRKDEIENFLDDYDFTNNRFMVEKYEPDSDYNDREQSQEDIYWEGGGGNEWSDPTQFWD